MMNKDGPCYECPDRYFGCFADCERYKAWRKKFDEAQQRIRNERDRDAQVTHYMAEMSRKQKRRKRK